MSADLKKIIGSMMDPLPLPRAFVTPPVTLTIYDIECLVRQAQIAYESACFGVKSAEDSLRYAKQSKTQSYRALDSLEKLLVEHKEAHGQTHTGKLYTYEQEGEES